ncbi:MAG TPA: methyltransferase dimerization domain-containing protein, partial [Tepidiformaceae bacterium]|nr:methyltransferase dimerization domain-containing protein [Tepidiformaceae bacterium]
MADDPDVMTDADLEDARMRIYAIEDGAVRAQALAFALKSGLFEALEEAPLTLEGISARLHVPMRVLPSLVAFLASQDLVRRDETSRAFSNSPAASAFLVRSSDSYVGGRGLLFAGFHEAMGHLGESLATGEPWTDEGQHDMFGAFDAHDQRWFAEGMFSNAVHGARALLKDVDLSGVRRLLDVGGNAGGYS